MSHARHPAIRSLLLALACATALLAALGAASARAATYGGLGRVGASVIKPGNGGAQGEVIPAGGHSFAVDTKNGDFFIAEEVTNGAKERVQEFGPKGEFLAEGSVPGPQGTFLGGLAVDAEKNRLFMLENEARPEEREAIGKKIEKTEEAIASKEAAIKKKEEKHESVTELKKELATLQEELAKLQKEFEVPLLDPGATAAARVFEFTTEANAEKKLASHTLASSAVLGTESEEPRAALIDPAGIAVDPKSHDVVLLGQQDEASAGFEEDPRAAVERIHENGSLGPRYVDKLNCLDSGEPVPEEPACKRASGEFPRSPIVTPTGTVYVELSGEVWELPATAESAEKEVAVHPKRLLTLDPGGSGQQQLLRFGGEEGVADTMSFVPSGPGKGTIFVDANLEGLLAGVVVLNYVETGGHAEVTERGWTGGQSQVSGQEKCAVPVGRQAALLGGVSGEDVLVFDALPGTGAFVDVMGFGSGGEACGHVSVTPPSVEYGEKKNATEVPTGTSAVVRSTVAGANAKSTKWTFKATTKAGLIEEGPFATGYQFEATNLAHEFTLIGDYEMIEEVETDNLGTSQVKVVSHVTGTLSPLIVKVAHPSSVHKEEKAAFEATVTDHNSTAPHLTYTWEFGDGSAPVKEEEAAGKSTVTRKVEHDYLTRCAASCPVKLTVEDGEGAKGTLTTAITVGESLAEIAAKKKAEEEAAAAAAAAKKQAEEQAAAAAKKKLEEEEEAAKHSVLGKTEVGNPQAKLASTSLSVGANGAFTLKVTCPAGETSCAGTVSMRTLTAVSAKAKKAILTLASGSFSVAGGQAKAVTLHLSAKARKLLSSSHVLRALTTLVAHDPAGVTRTTTATVTLKLAKASHKKH